jgi:hypothetical protein
MARNIVDGLATDGLAAGLRVQWSVRDSKAKNCSTSVAGPWQLRSTICSTICSTFRNAIVAPRDEAMPFT